MAVDFSKTAAVVRELEKRWPKALPNRMRTGIGHLWYRDEGIPDADARDLMAGRLLRLMEAHVSPSAARLAPVQYTATKQRCSGMGCGDDPFAALAALALDLPPGTKLFPKEDDDD